MSGSRPGVDDQWDDDADKVLGDDAPPTAADRKEVERRDVRSKSAAQMATNLHLAGFNWAEIAERCEYSSARVARAAVEKVLANVYGDVDRVAARNTMTAQLDGVLKSLAPRALHSKTRSVDERTGEVVVRDNEWHLPYAGAFVKVLEQKAKLLGLNAPQVVALVDPEAEQFQDVLRIMASEDGLAVGEDVDIFDLEEGEDGVYRSPDDEA